MEQKQKKLSPEYRLHKKLLRQMGEAIREFALIERGDAVLLGLSGGKDSLALLDLLGEMMAHTNHSFRVVAVHVRVSGVDYLSDTDYLREKAEEWGIPLLVKETNMEPDRNVKRTPCFLCSWNRRKVLFRTAQDLGCNKIALGHHQDDILRTALMNLAFNGSFSTMPAKLAMRKFPVTLIRPLAKICEDDLRQWATLQSYQPVRKVCPHDDKTNRTSVGRVVEEFSALTPEFCSNMWHALLKAGALVQ